MASERVIWTALPNQRDTGNRLRLSVHVSPRLSGGGATLGGYPAFANWPKRLESLAFAVEFDNGLSLEAIAEPLADPELWLRLFPATTPVMPHQFRDHSQRDLHVFPVSEVHEFLQTTYGKVGAAGTGVPSVDSSTGPLADFRPLARVAQVITDSSSFYQELDKAHSKGGGPGQVIEDNIADAGLSPSAQAAQNAFFNAYRFYYRPASQRPDLPADYIEPPPAVPDFDFHQRVAQLADHPTLLRMLGLVVDLIVDVGSAGAMPPSTGTVRVIPKGDLPESPPITPLTRYDLDGTWFGAAPANSSRLSRGLLRVSNEHYTLYQVDVDGAALQVVGFASTLEALRDTKRRDPHQAAEATVPALRSAGIALARQGRGHALLEDLKDRKAKNATIESGGTAVFSAEDLVRGYRVDVEERSKDGQRRWRSLHRRIAAHVVKGGANQQPRELEPITDEGYLKATSASGERTDHPVPVSDDLYLHEAVVGWHGWSLSAPRPGKNIVEPGQGDNGSSIARYDPEAGNPSPLVSAIAVAPRTLPRLRIGGEYRMRVRTVDLAGNSLAFSEEDYRSDEGDVVTEPTVYRRFEPVPSPTVLRRHLDTEGESLEHLVIRSNLGMTAQQYVTSPQVVQSLQDAGAAHAYAADSQRHLAAPKASEQMAEEDGKFDAAFGAPPATAQALATSALRVALREEGTFLDPMIVDPASGLATVPQTTITLHPPGTPLPPRGEAPPQGAYAIYPDESVLLPYLPDPWAIGVSLTGYDHAGAEVAHLTAAFPGDWPAPAPFRVRLTEGALGMAFVEGVLEVTLPKAHVVRARLSSVFPPRRLGDFGVWPWIQMQSTAALSDALAKEARDGRHWMLTPFRWMTFTHAVQQPLEVPDMSGVAHGRKEGSTYASFSGAIVNHALSTGRLDVFGEWTEDVDLVTDDEPRMTEFGTAVPHSAQAFGFDIGPGETLAHVNEKGAPGRLARHEFGDTKYRAITYHSVATTRFREYFPTTITGDLANIQRTESVTGGDGTPKPALVHHIESSARPAAPVVLYVVPTFRWERDDASPTRRHTRRGNAVRVWLRRPWFSSGDGELLAVVLEPALAKPAAWQAVGIRDLAKASSAPSYHAARIAAARRLARKGAPAQVAGRRALPSGASAFEMLASPQLAIEAITSVLLPDEETRRRMKPYVTNWGGDPVWQSALCTQPPTAASFPRRVTQAWGVSLEELPGVQVAIAAHPVHFDRDGRKLWYCDIEINAGATYWPFVRLALARYQPHSVQGMHLSRVVMTDFMQLAPDRTADVTVTDGVAHVSVRGYSGRNILATIPANVFLPGIEELGGAGETTPNTTMRMALERRVPGIPGDLGWERVGSEVTLAPQAVGYHVAWSGSIGVQAAAGSPGQFRIVLTESETFLRDYMQGDPIVSTSPLDFVRERVVYADTFEL